MGVVVVLDRLTAVHMRDTKRLCDVDPEARAVKPNGEDQVRNESTRLGDDLSPSLVRQSPRLGEGGSTPLPRRPFGDHRLLDVALDDGVDDVRPESSDMASRHDTSMIVQPADRNARISRPASALAPWNVGKGRWLVTTINRPRDGMLKSPPTRDTGSDRGIRPRSTFPDSREPLRRRIRGSRKAPPATPSLA